MEQENKTTTPASTPPQVTPLATQPSASFPDTSEAPHHTSKLGSIVVLVAIIALIILGGLYLWSTTLEAPTLGINATSTATTTATTTTADATGDQQPLSSSDSVSSVEQDLNATDIESADAGLDSAQASLNTEVNASVAQ